LLLFLFWAPPCPAEVEKRFPLDSFAPFSLFAHSRCTKDHQTFFLPAGRRPSIFSLLIFSDIGLVIHLLLSCCCEISVFPPLLSNLCQETCSFLTPSPEPLTLRWSGPLLVFSPFFLLSTASFIQMEGSSFLSALQRSHPTQSMRSLYVDPSTRAGPFILPPSYFEAVCSFFEVVLRSLRAFLGKGRPFLLRLAFPTPRPSSVRLLDKLPATRSRSSLPRLTSFPDFTDVKSLPSQFAAYFSPTPHSPKLGTSSPTGTSVEETF